MLKIIDFGLAHQIQPGKKYQVMQALGTPIICSPERMRSEPYDYTADVWSCMGIFQEMLTGNFMWFPEFSEAGILTLTFKIGDLKAPPMELVPDSLGLPKRVLDLFRYGWDIDASRRYHAADLLKLVNGIYTDLENGTLTYEEQIPIENLLEEAENMCVPQIEGAMMSVSQKVLTSFTIQLPSQRFVVNKSDTHGLHFVDSEDGAVSGRNVLNRPLLPKIDVQTASLESNQDASMEGNVPRFLHSDANSSNQMVVNSLSQSMDQGSFLNMPALSILDKTHSGDSFSVPVTIFNSPRNLKSSDLGSSTQPSMELEIQMQSVTTSGIDPGLHRTSLSYCPTSEMTDASVCTLTEAAISRSDHQDDIDTDGQMVLPADTRGAVAGAESMQSPEDQSMPFDQCSKGSSSSSDEMLQKLQQEVEFDHQRRSLSDKLPDDDHSVEYACSIGAKSPGTPSGSGFSNRSSVSGASEARRKISEEGRPRFLEKVNEMRQGQGNAVASPVPVVVFHKNNRDGQVNEIVSFTCSTEYRRQQIRDVIDTVASRLHKVFSKFTVRDVQSNFLTLDDTIDKILPEQGHTIHLLVLEADPNQDQWYIDDHEVHRPSLY